MSFLGIDMISFWQNFSVEWPWMLACLPLPWIIKHLIKPAEQQETPLLAPQITHRLQQVATQDARWRPQIKTPSIGFLYSFLWLLLIIAAMRPVWYLTPTPFTVSGKDMILAVDLSGSMEKEDMRVSGQRVNRLVAVKSVVESFIEKRQGDRLGLVVFGSQAFIQSPLSYDLNTVQTLLNETEIGMAGNNTAIGDAIGLTLKHLDQSKQLESKHKTVLILLTDGSNTAGFVQPFDAASKAKEAGLKIYTIGIGQSQGNGVANFFNLSRNDMDIPTLKKIAELTQGQFFHASDTKQLDEIYQLINQLESSEHKIHQYRLKTELHIWPLSLFLALSLTLAFLKIFRPELRKYGAFSFRRTK